MENVGVLGGTFDPPHTGHIVMARTVLQRLPLTRVLFAPAPRPPHKDSREVTPYESRKAMLEAALKGEDRMEISVLEELRDGLSYTVDLLRHIKRTSDDRLFLIVGADTAADLVTWKEPEALLQLATLVVFPRTGYSSMVPVGGNASIVLFEEPVIDVSSTHIRAAYRRRRPEPRWVPAAVHQFILDNSLYS
jgi:nicotinate-nucleotide adenylyltransferase